MTLLHAAGFTQAALLALYFFRGYRRPGNIYEGLLLTTLAGAIAFGYLYGTRTILEFPHLARFGFTFMALIGPLLYLAVRARDTVSNRLYPTDLWFWLIPCGIFVYLLPFHLSSEQTKLQYLREDLEQIHFDCVVILYCALFNNVAAITASIKRMHRAGERIVQQTQTPAAPASDRAQPAPRTTGNFWFHAVPLGLILISGFVSALDPNILNSGLFSGVTSLLILVRSYLLLYRQEHSADDDPADTLYPPAARYQKALLSPQFVEDRGRAIQAYLDEEEPHLEPDFQLADIARHLGLSAVQSSQIINRYFHKNFFQLTQSIRVAAAQELMRTRPAQTTVLDIALESGFNSKSAFNSAFKRVTGQTPTDWRKQHA